jgi:hypothetical protein
VSRGNDSIVKGNFVTVRIPTVDRASGNLPRLLCKVVDVGGLNTYVKGDICSHTELLSFYICTILQYNYLCSCIFCKAMKNLLA